MSGLIEKTSSLGSYGKEWRKLGFDTAFNSNQEGELWH
jgi:hypothetical protein